MKKNNGTQDIKLATHTMFEQTAATTTLFRRDIKTIGKHIGNVLSEGELEKESTVAKFATVQKEGDRMIERQIEYYNLDVIISVGYRVKSKQGTQFRIWATNVLKDYLLKGYALNQRMNRIEDNFEDLSKKVNNISLQLKTAELPTQGIFFDGQIFDAYELASKIIRSAKKSILLIDNYVDETTLILLSKKKKEVQAVLLCKHIGNQLKLDIKKANEQYGGFEVKTFTQSHDRFLIIDRKEIFHLAASLKDLGKKWFAFSKMNKEPVESLMIKIKELI